jgi:predicted porin
LAANYHQAKFNEPVAPVAHLRVYEAYAAYDFGPVKLGALYGRRVTKLANDLKAADDIELDQWLVGATWKITSSDSLLVSYANRRVDIDARNIPSARDTRLGQLAIGYDHALSKRTVLYARYAHQYQNRAQKNELPDGLSNYEGLLGIAGYTPGNAHVTSNAGFGGEGYRQGFAVGVRHDF